jgi:hypothetical protein
MTPSKPAGLLLAALAALAPATASADGVTGPQVASLLERQGYPARLETDALGDPIIRTRMSGVDVSLLFYDCAHERCHSLQFATGLHLDGVAPEVINRFNRAYRYATAYLDDENDPFLRLDFDVRHAQPDAHILSQVDTWKNTLGVFLEAMDFEPAQEP